jgi:hypothetical protein
LSLFSSLNFLRFSLDKNQIDFCPVRADFFGSAAGGHIRQAECKGAALKSEPRELGRANTLTIFFEMRSNFSKNEHRKRSGEAEFPPTPPFRLARAEAKPRRPARSEQSPAKKLSFPFRRKNCAPN